MSEVVDDLYAQLEKKEMDYRPDCIALFMGSQQRYMEEFF